MPIRQRKAGLHMMIFCAVSKRMRKETATIWEKNCKRERLVDGYSTGLFSVIMGAYGEERKV